MSMASRFAPELRMPSPDRTSQSDSPNGAMLSVVNVSSGSATGEASDSLAAALLFSWEPPARPGTRVWTADPT
jgi:hypothetical protein